MPTDWDAWWREHGRRELRCILMTAWDPVGASDTPEAWDEYDDYADGVAHRLRDAEDPEQAAAAVEAYLAHVEREWMGIDRPAAQRESVADALVAWHEWSFLRGGRPPREWIDAD